MESEADMRLENDNDDDKKEEDIPPGAQIKVVDHVLIVCSKNLFDGGGILG